MSNLRPTKIKIEFDEFKNVTSTIHGHNQDVMAFNMGLITQHYPVIASELMRVYDELPNYERDVGVELVVVR